MIKDPTTLTLSPSKVDTFLGCKRLFKYRYINPPFTPAQNRYFLIGNIAHKALETLHKEHMQNPIKNWNVAMGQHFKNAVKIYRVDRHIFSGILTQDDLFSIKKMLGNYLHYVKENVPRVRKVEQLKRIDVGGIVVWLKADRIDSIKGGRYRVVDYKSGNVSPKKDERASVQIPSYGLLIKQHIDKDAIVEGAYLYLKFMGANHGIRKYEITEEWIADAVKRYHYVDSELKAGCYFTQNWYYKYCRICDFHEHCVEDQDNGV